MNQRIRQLTLEARSAMPKGTLEPEAWLEVYHDVLGRLVTEDCVRTLRNNGYDDAADCLTDVHFGMKDPV